MKNGIQSKPQKLKSKVGRNTNSGEIISKYDNCYPQEKIRKNDAFTDRDRKLWRGAFEEQKKFKSDIRNIKLIRRGE